MFEALRDRLKEVQEFEDRLVAAAIDVANELRQKVRQGRREKARVRRETKAALRATGLSAAEARRKTRGRRGTSGVSIVADATGDGVRVTASNQVQHLRREQAETPDLMEKFRQNFSIGESLKRGS